MPRAACALAALSTLAVLGARPAAAEGFRGLHLEGWYGKVGLETGVVFARERGAAPLLGAVATLVRMNRHLEWYGLQADLLADWNGDADAGARWSFGPELGVSIFGVDASYFGERTAGDTRHGMQARAKLTVGVAAVYLRATAALAGADETSLEMGLQMKLPVWIDRHKAASPRRALALRDSLGGGGRRRLSSAVPATGVVSR